MLDTFRTAIFPFSYHSSFNAVHEKIESWTQRFSKVADNTIYNDFSLLYLLSSKNFLDHRDATHLFRLVLSIHLMQKKLARATTFSSRLRHLEIRWIPTELLFPSALKPVLGCLISFNSMDRYEIFNEDNIIPTLQKHLPQSRLVSDSSYSHQSQPNHLKTIYFEIEKLDGTPFSLDERKILKNNLDEKVKKSIEPVSPIIYMGVNEEETNKNILILSGEITSTEDLPQAYITLDQQTSKEVIFSVAMVYICPFHHFSLRDRFLENIFVLQRVIVVRHFENRPVEANIFRIHLPREASLLRRDGSLDFYAARQKVVSLIIQAIGEFRDYNGGLLIKQQELLHSFKESFSKYYNYEPELMESFFYALTPLANQASLPQKTLLALFSYFLENRKQKLPKDALYAFQTYFAEEQIFFIVSGKDTSLISTISSFLEDHSFRNQNITYNFIETADGVFFNCVILKTEESKSEKFIELLQDFLDEWNHKVKDRKVLKTGSEHSLLSLDPRIGGDPSSSNILRLLFEGLTRFGQNGQMENGVAESIEISSDSKTYQFKLRFSLWNDGSYVSAYDFEYAWKKILSPDFKTTFAHFFYMIKNARKAKEGKVSPDEIGIHVIDDRTLKVELERFTPYFLQLTAHPVYSPVHRSVDQNHPQWPYQCEKKYPCNGSFELKINQPDQGYQLIKNPSYWDAANIILDQINWTLMNPSQIIRAFHNKELDWIGNPFGGWHSFYKPEAEDRLITYSCGWVCWFVFNTSYAPLQNSKLRQAFAYAIKRSQIVSYSTMPLSAAFSPIHTHTDHKNNPFFPDFDPNKARELFKEALHELKMDKEDLPTMTLLFHEKGARELAAHCLKEQFEECLGIKVNVQSQSWLNNFNSITQGDFQMALVEWNSWIDDGFFTLEALKFSRDQANFSNWEDPAYQEILDLAENEVSPFRRSTLLTKAERILTEQMPIIPIFHSPTQALVQKEADVVYRLPAGPFQFGRCFYKKK